MRVLTLTLMCPSATLVEVCFPLLLNSQTSTRESFPLTPERLKGNRQVISTTKNNQTSRGDEARQSKAQFRVGPSIVTPFWFRLGPLDQYYQHLLITRLLLNIITQYNTHGFIVPHQQV